MLLVNKVFTNKKFTIKGFPFLVLDFKTFTMKVTFPIGQTQRD